MRGRVMLIVLPRVGCRRDLRVGSERRNYEESNQ